MQFFNINLLKPCVSTNKMTFVNIQKLLEIQPNACPVKNTWELSSQSCRLKLSWEYMVKNRGDWCWVYIQKQTNTQYTSHKEAWWKAKKHKRSGQSLYQQRNTNTQGHCSQHKWHNFERMNKTPGSWSIWFVSLCLCFRWLRLWSAHLLVCICLFPFIELSSCTVLSTHFLGRQDNGTLPVRLPCLELKVGAEQTEVPQQLSCQSDYFLNMFWLWSVGNKYQVPTSLTRLRAMPQQLSSHLHYFVKIFWLSFGNKYHRVSTLRQGWQ